MMTGSGYVKNERVSGRVSEWMRDFECVSGYVSGWRSGSGEPSLLYFSFDPMSDQWLPLNPKCTPSPRGPVHGPHHVHAQPPTGGYVEGGARQQARHESSESRWMQYYR